MDISDKKEDEKASFEARVRYEKVREAERGGGLLGILLGFGIDYLIYKVDWLTLPSGWLGGIVAVGIPVLLGVVLSGLTKKAALDKARAEMGSRDHLPDPIAPTQRIERHESEERGGDPENNGGVFRSSSGRKWTPPF